MDVQKIASLAKLRIRDDEVEAFSRDMEAIVKLVESLPPVEDGECPLEGQAVMALREDVVTPSLPREELLQNAPAATDGYFVVPKVLD